MISVRTSQFFQLNCTVGEATINPREGAISSHPIPAKKGETVLSRFNNLKLTVFPLVLITLSGCHELVPHDTKSLLLPHFQRSELVGLVAGFGTTFAALPDLIAMLRRRSCAGMNPRMSAIMGAFQILWVYYGLLIVSRPVVVWNVIAVLTNFLAVAAYIHFARKERTSTTGLH